MNKKQRYVLYLTALASTMSLAISSIDLAITIKNDTEWGYHEDGAVSAEHKEVLKSKANEFTKDLGIEFTVDEAGYNSINSTVQTETDMIEITVYIDENGGLENVYMMSKSLKESKESNEAVSKIIKYFTGKTSNPEKALDVTKKLFNELTSEEYVSSYEYKEGLEYGMFEKNENISDSEVISVGLDNPHNPVQGVGFDIYFH